MLRSLLSGQEHCMPAVPEAGFSKAQHKLCEVTFLLVVNRKGHKVTIAGHHRDLKHLPNVETRVYCPQAFLILKI